MSHLFRSDSEALALTSMISSVSGDPTCATNLTCFRLRQDRFWRVSALHEYLHAGMVS